MLPPPPAIAAPQERALYLGLNQLCTNVWSLRFLGELSCCFVLERRASITLAETLSDIGCSLESIHGFFEKPVRRAHISKSAVSVNLGDFKTIVVCVKNQAGLVQKLRI